MSEFNCSNCAFVKSHGFKNANGKTWGELFCSSLARINEINDNSQMNTRVIMITQEWANWALTNDKGYCLNHESKQR